MGFDLETLVILAVLAFILFGPEKLPEYAAMLGKFVAKMRQATTEMTRQYQDQNPFHYPPEPALPPAPDSACPHCQQPVTLNFAFCPKCGHRLNQIITRRRPMPPEPAPPAEPLRPSLLNRCSRPIPGFGRSITRKLIGPWRSSIRPPWPIKG